MKKSFKQSVRNKRLLDYDELKTKTETSGREGRRRVCESGSSKVREADRRRVTS